jgi:valyl-tRNA synthetase
MGWPNQTTDLKAFYPTSLLKTGHDILMFLMEKGYLYSVHSVWTLGVLGC